MSASIKVEHTGRLLRAVFVEEIRRTYARFTEPDGTVVTPEMQARQRRDGFTARLRDLVMTLEPLLVEIAATQGGVPLTIDDPRFPGRRHVVDLAPAVGLSAPVHEFFVTMALPSPPSEAERKRLYACARKVWKR